MMISHSGLSKCFVASSGKTFSTFSHLHQQRCHYEILGVKRDASKAEIKASFYDLSKKYHPDRTQDCPESAAKFKEVLQAYEVLGSPIKRASYDMHAGFPSAPGYRYNYQDLSPRRPFRSPVEDDILRRWREDQIRIRKARAERDYSRFSTKNDKNFMIFYKWFTETLDNFQLALNRAFTQRHNRSFKRRSYHNNFRRQGDILERNFSNMNYSLRIVTMMIIMLLFTTVAVSKAEEDQDRVRSPEELEAEMKKRFKSS